MHIYFKRGIKSLRSDRIMCGSLCVLINISKKLGLVLLTITLLSFPANAKRNRLPKFGKSSRHAFFNEAKKLARENYDKKNFKDALKNLKAAMRYSSKGYQKYWVFYMQYSTLMQMKDYEGAVAVAKKGARSSFINRSLRETLLLKQVYVLLYRLKRFPDALKICNRLNEKIEDAYDYKCRIYDKLKEYDKMLSFALRLTEYAARKQHKNMYIRGKNHQITALLRQNKADIALTVFSSADYFKMNSGEKLNYLIRMGSIYQTQKNFVAAASVLEKANKLGGLDKAQKARLLMAQIRTFYYAQEFQKALILCDKLSRTEEKREYAYNMKYNIYNRLKDYDKMLKAAFSLTLVAKPDSPMYYRGKKNQINALIYKENYTKTMTIFTSADISKMNVETKSDYYNCIGKIHQAKNDYLTAARTYEKSGMTSDSYNAILGNLYAANMYVLCNKDNDALRAYAKVLENKKARSEQKISVIYKSAELLRKTGKYAEALEIIVKINKIPGHSKLDWASAKLLTAKILAEQGKIARAKRDCSAAKRIFESIISSSSYSESDINKALDKWTECDISLIDKPDSPRYKIKTGRFLLNTKLPEHDNKIKISYMVPVDPKGKPLPSAHNIIFYGPYAGEQNHINRDSLRYFAGELGFTVFTISINANNRNYSDNKQKCYIFKESGSHNMVFMAQQKLIHDFKLKSSKLLLMGHSSGGSMVQQIAIHHPDKVDAVALVGGNTYNPICQNTNIAWLTLYTWGDQRIPRMRKFKEHAQSIGIQVLLGETPTLLYNKDNRHAHHSPSNLVWKLMQTFLRDVAELRKNNNGVMPPAEKWPIEKIINNEKQYFPSKKFASLWKKLPHESTALFENKNYDSHIIVMPPSGLARAIVLFIHDPSFYGSTHLIDNLYFLAKQNNIAITVKVSDNHFKTLEKIKNTLEFILQNEKWKNLQVYVLGSGGGGRLAAIAALSNGNPRINKITTLNSEYRWPFKELSPVRYRRKSQIPLVMLVDNENSLIKTRSRRTKPVLIKSNGQKFGKWWFYLLAKAAKK
jgi:alpha/beta hydrolase fold